MVSVVLMDAVKKQSNEAMFGKTLTRMIVILVSTVIALTSMSAPIAQRHRVLTEILSTYVHNGIVNYKELKSDKRLSEYTAWLAKTNPDSLPNEREKLAFWINAYNAFTLKIICDNYPLESINELHAGGLIVGSVLKTTVWDKDLVTVNGMTMSLNAIEHKIVRPRFKDPRAHFAFVCASKSCPALRAEAYEGGNLERQLNDQAKAFLTDSFRNEFDPIKKRATISKIFSWYESDFGASEEDVLRYAARFLPDKISRQILTDAREWDIEFKDYDWSLNGY